MQIWRSYNPDWLMQLAGNRDALRQALIHHVGNVSSRYVGRTLVWDVVNEPLADVMSELVARAATVLARFVADQSLTRWSPAFSTRLSLTTSRSR